MRVLLWRVRWHAARTRVQHAQRRAYYRVRTLLLFWRIAVRMAQAGRSSPMAWAIILCPPLLLLWPVLWLGLHLVLR